MTMEQLGALQQLLNDMWQKAFSTGASEQDIALYLATYISFEAGNASRPDVIDNLSLSEFLGWNQEFENSKECDDALLLRVSYLFHVAHAISDIAIQMYVVHLYMCT